MDVGMGVLALAELNRMESVVRRNSGPSCSEVSGMQEWKEHHENFVFKAKSQVHGFRSALYGRRIAEDKLIAALKAENANHPLASREAVDAVADDELARALLNPEVIKKTYPDGKLPKNAVEPPNLVHQAV